MLSFFFSRVLFSLSNEDYATFTSAGFFLCLCRLSSTNRRREKVSFCMTLSNANNDNNNNKKKKEEKEHMEVTSTSSYERRRSSLAPRLFLPFTARCCFCKEKNNKKTVFSFFVVFFFCVGK